MNLEQVKEHFKYAKEVRCLTTKQIVNINNLGGLGIYECSLTVWASLNDGNFAKLYNSKTNQLAEILTYIFDRGEEVEVRDDKSENWLKRKFISFDLNGVAIIQNLLGKPNLAFNIRKLTPESLLEPQLTELKKTAEANGMSVEIIFKQK